VATTQTLSGTGALYIGFDFLKHHLPRFVYIPDPTWLNHKNIIEDCGLKWIEYPYFNSKTLGSNIPGMIKFLSNAIAGSVVLLHACAHNPTGVDPTEEEWKQIADVMKKNNLIPFFDSAYQGFATGDLEKDAWPIRYFLEQGFQMIIAQSFAKNMGLYGERVGALHFVTSCKDTCEKVLSQIKYCRILTQNHHQKEVLKSTSARGSRRSDHPQRPEVVRKLEVRTQRRGRQEDHRNEKSTPKRVGATGHSGHLEPHN
jgi:aspartate/tyrosine/aromatic aminotransferase